VNLVSHWYASSAVNNSSQQRHDMEAPGHLASLPLTPVSKTAGSCARIVHVDRMPAPFRAQAQSKPPNQPATKVKQQVEELLQDYELAVPVAVGLDWCYS
jgi:hypothetical protein